MMDRFVCAQSTCTAAAQRHTHCMRESAASCGSCASMSAVTVLRATPFRPHASSFAVVHRQNLGLQSSTIEDACNGVLVSCGRHAWHAAIMSMLHAQLAAWQSVAFMPALKPCSVPCPFSGQNGQCFTSNSCYRKMCQAQNTDFQLPGNMVQPTAGLLSPQQETSKCKLIIIKPEMWQACMACRPPVSVQCATCSRAGGCIDASSCPMPIWQNSKFSSNSCDEKGAWH
jgi:hypothetical protein